MNKIASIPYDPPTNCCDCLYFQVAQEPIKASEWFWDFGMVRCLKHHLVREFSSKKELKQYKCIEKTGKVEK